MSKLKIPLKREGCFLFFKCRCGAFQAINRAMPWCASCQIEYDIGAGEVALRPKRKTSRFAFAKALNATGGVKIGGGE